MGALIDDEAVLGEIRRAARGGPSLSQREFEANAAIAVNTVRRHFGSWNRAVVAAGLEPLLNGAQQKVKATDDEYLLELLRVESVLGRPPSEARFENLSVYSVKPYKARWGSLKVALESAHDRFER